MKFISWNVNGLRACMNKGFLDSFYALDADFFCLQETKLQEGQISLDLPGYEQYWCYADKKGYSGTAIFTKHTPQSVHYGLDVAELDTEGRLITLEYPEFYLITCYTPNAQRGLARIEHRLKWEDAFRGYVTMLDQKKPVIICGDLNVAHKEIDLKNPNSNRGNAGFSDEERSAFCALLDSGFTDTFRHLYPDKTGAYSWWSYMFNARQNNAGWRIDYFLVSDRLKETVIGAAIHQDVMGSDHCPVSLDLDTACNGGIWSPAAQQPIKHEAKEADGDFPAGQPHTALKITVAAIIALALMLPGLKLLRQDAPTADTTGISESTASQDLIAGVIDRTGTIKITWDVDSPLSSELRQCFTDGQITWLLFENALSISAAMGERQPTFFVEIPFTENVDFTPTVNLSVSYPNSCYGLEDDVIDYCFYYKDNKIGGFFVYGYLSEDIILDIEVSHGSMESSASIAVHPDVESLKTWQLVDAMIASQQLTGAYLSSTANAVDLFLQDDLCARELLTRDNAVRALLNACSPSNWDTVNALRLLQHKAFYSLMTDDEKSELELLSREYFYGDSIIAQ